MPALVNLVLFFFLDVVEPVLFVQEELAAARTFHDTVLVGFLGMPHKLVVTFEPNMTFFTLVPAKDAHKMLCAEFAKKMTEKERVATPLVYLLRLMLEAMA